MAGSARSRKSVPSRPSAGSTRARAVRHRHAPGAQPLDLEVVGERARDARRGRGQRHQHEARRELGLLGRHRPQCLALVGHQALLSMIRTSTGARSRTSWRRPRCRCARPSASGPRPPAGSGARPRPPRPPSSRRCRSPAAGPRPLRRRCPSRGSRRCRRSGRAARRGRSGRSRPSPPRAGGTSVPPRRASRCCRRPRRPRPRRGPARARAPRPGAIECTRPLTRSATAAGPTSQVRSPESRSTSWGEKWS